MAFRDIPKNKQIIIDKISFYIKQYAKFNRVAKYIYLEKFSDPRNVYTGVLLDKSKLFLHTSFFKKYKKEHAMLDREGKSTASFFSHRDCWFEDHHSAYMVAEDVMYKVFNNASKITMNDLIDINNLYKDLQIECRKGK